MKYILTLLFIIISTATQGQPAGINIDSLRQARMRQMQEQAAARSGNPATAHPSPSEPGAVPMRPSGNAPTTPPRTQGETGNPQVRPSGDATPTPIRPSSETAAGLIGNQPAQFANTPPGQYAAANPAVPTGDSVRLHSIRESLNWLELADTNYSAVVEELSISALPLSEMLRNIAKVYNVNINVKGAENLRITCNFARAKITDLLYFLCKEYNLNLDVVGNIVSVYPAVAPAPQPKTIQVMAGSRAGTVSYDLAGDRISDVVRLLTSVTGVNFIVAPSATSKTVSGYAKDLPVEDAILSLAGANDLVAKRNSSGIWELAAADATTSSYRRQSAFNADEISMDSLGLITARIARGNVQEIITDLCETRNINYFFVTPVSHHVPLNVHDVTFEMLLNIMFMGTQYGYYYEEGIYFFGTFSKETLNSVRIIPLSYRSVSKVADMIPTSIKGGLQIQTFADLNSVIVSGDQREVQRVENFIRALDKRVPQVTIEVIIADVTKKVIMEAGVDVGLNGARQTTTGSMNNDGLDINMNAGSVNNLINSFNGFGSVNLGKVSSDFYLGLKFLEENGTIRVHSTPKLSTLNGSQASLSSGNKSYYKEITTNFWGSQTPTPSESYVWKEVEANLEIKITPMVSEDMYITLDIEIVQSEFTDLVAELGPPGIASRSFKSTIRVQNEEMVLLGGIDRNSTEKSSAGLPFIARVPVFKWLFGKSKNNKVDRKLNVFIKPTLID